MKKTLLSFSLLCCFGYMKAQNLTYGSILGLNIYDVEISGPIDGGAGTGFNIGGYLDYKLNESFGVRIDLTYNIITEYDYYIDNIKVIDKINIQSLSLRPLARFDVNQEYNKGFYLVGGLTLANILSSKADNIANEDFYKKFNLSAVLGFGINFGRHFGFEILPEIGLSDALESTESKSIKTGAYLNLTLNLESLL